MSDLNTVAPCVAKYYADVSAITKSIGLPLVDLEIDEKIESRSPQIW